MPFINVTIDEEIINLILAPQQMVPTSVCYFYNNKNSLRNNEKKSFKLTTRHLSYKKLELSRSIVLIINCGLSLKLNLVGDMSIVSTTMYYKLQV